MSKHRYTNMSALLPETKRMLESGMSHRAIEELKFEGYPIYSGGAWQITLQKDIRQGDCRRTAY